MKDKAKDKSDDALLHLEDVVVDMGTDIMQDVQERANEQNLLLSKLLHAVENMDQRMKDWFWCLVGKPIQGKLHSIDDLIKQLTPKSFSESKGNNTHVNDNHVIGYIRTSKVNQNGDLEIVVSTPPVQRKTNQSKPGRQGLILGESVQLCCPLPCLHATDSECLKLVISCGIMKYGKTKFFCPYDECGVEWSYKALRPYIKCTIDEMKKYDCKITENVIKKDDKIKKCPRCLSLCMQQNNKNRRVICPICTNDSSEEFHFCWNCDHKWNLCICG